MLLYPYPRPVDKTPFRTERPTQALYGLPIETKFCRSCVISNQRPSSTAEFKNDGKAPKRAIHFDDQDICDACRVKEQKINIDWKQREQELRELCDRHRRTDGRYDCWCLEVAEKTASCKPTYLNTNNGMHPLTCTWAPHIYTDWGWKPSGLDSRRFRQYPLHSQWPCTSINHSPCR